MDLHYKQEIGVGLLVIAAVGTFALGAAWLSGKSIGPSDTVRVPVRFADVNGLRAGDPVQTSGVRVGRVEDVVLEDVGRVMVYLSVDRDSRPHADARAAVASLDFFGTKYIDYQPGRAPDLMADGSVITGSREIALTEGAAGLTERATEFLSATQSILSQRTADDIHNTMVAATQALEVITKVGSGPGVEEATEALKSVQLLAARLDSILGNPAIGKSVDQLDELTTNLNEMSEGLASMTKTLAQILEKMESGQGTFGRVMNDSTMYVNLNATMKAMQELLEDVRRNPGRYINVKVF
jgi:phospholipid/cholesterol/gamma-HCH transport system substrate-binding protein